MALLVVGGMEAKSKVGALEKKIGQFWGYVMLFGGSEGPPVVRDGGYRCCDLW